MRQRVATQAVYVDDPPRPVDDPVFVNSTPGVEFQLGSAVALDIFRSRREHLHNQLGRGIELAARAQDRCEPFRAGPDDVGRDITTIVQSTQLEVPPPTDAASARDLIGRLQPDITTTERMMATTVEIVRMIALLSSDL